jgi:O-antigen/teichoic acid export membrane protein
VVVQRVRRADAADPAAAARRLRGGRRLGTSVRGGIVLGVATAVANALGYAFTVVLARAFTPAEYGALVALLGAGLIGTIPAAGLQYVVARRTVALGLARDRNDAVALPVAAAAGGALFLVAGAVSPVARSYLHLSGIGPMLALGVALVPMTLAGVVQGSLLGRSRFTALGTLYVVTALGRFAGGVVTAVAGWDVTGAMSSLAVAATLTTAFGWLLTGPRSWRPAGSGRLRRPQAGGGLTGDVARACSAVAGIIVLSNVDLLLARHYLDRETSGAYGVAALFAKALLWSAQFVAQAAYPGLARPAGRRRLLGLALIGTAGIGLAGIALTAFAAEPAIRALTGQATYGDAARLAPWFALLGLAWALAQVLLLAAVAASERRAGRLLWAVIGVETGLVVLGLHHSPGQILTACLVTVAGYIAVVAVLDARLARRPATGTDEVAVQAPRRPMSPGAAPPAPAPRRPNPREPTPPRQDGARPPGTER